MRKYRPLLTAVLTVAAVLALAACGSSSNSSPSAGTTSGTSPSSSSSSGKAGGTVTLLYGTAPQSLDPGFDYTTQGAEINWIAYTGLVTYAHENGIAGAKLIPGLCTAMPTISNGGKTYSCTLRSGLVFSNGAPVKASDFTWAVERNIKIPWGGSGQFVTPTIAGAMAFSTGKAKTISGITTNDTTGLITIHLTAPYGPFMNVLAEPSMAPVPKGTPFSNQPNSPPAGVGPYKVTNIVPNVSFVAEPNPYWSKMNIPGIPAAKVTVDAKISSNVPSNAESVLNNSADFFDWADTIPGSLLPQIHSQASDRFSLVNQGGSTYYIFMNMKEKPFSSQTARAAVVTGLNQGAMNRLGAGTLVPACFFLPPAVPGHPSGTCPYGDPSAGGNIAKAKQLVQQSGMAGVPITVWSETRSPRQQWMTYYTQFLKQIGFTNVTQKVLADATYFTTIGELKLHPQTGFADWNMDFPNPIDFYGVLLDGNAILPTNNENFGETDDPYINQQVAKISTISDQAQLAKEAEALDTYTAQKAYVAVFGYQTFPKFTSNRINYGALVFHPLYGWDWTSFSLK